MTPSSEADAILLNLLLDALSKAVRTPHRTSIEASIYAVAQRIEEREKAGPPAPTSCGCGSDSERWYHRERPCLDATGRKSKGCLHHEFGSLTEGEAISKGIRRYR